MNNNENNELTIKVKYPKGEDGHKNFSIRIRKDIFNELEKISSKTGHSRNELIGIFLEYAIKHCKIIE